MMITFFYGSPETVRIAVFPGRPHLQAEMHYCCNQTNEFFVDVLHEVLVESPPHSRSLEILSEDELGDF